MSHLCLLYFSSQPFESLGAFLRNTVVRLDNKSLLELQAEEDKAIENLKIERQNLQIIRNMKKSLTNNALTKRLCDHGRLLEKYFPPDDFTDDQVERILLGLLQNPGNKKAIEILKNGGHINW